MRRFFLPGWVKAAPALLAILTPLLLAGCGSSPSGSDGTEGNPPEASIDLNQEWGGLTDVDEPANFSEPEIARLGDLQAAAEPMKIDPRVVSLEQKPNRTVVFVRMVWGNLSRNAPDSTSPGPVTTWDGSLTTTSGALLVQNLILFERDDHVVRPRTDPAVLAWISRTAGGIDGILVRVVYNPDSTGADDRLTFSTSPLAISFPLLQLADLDTTIATDANGNGVAITAVNDDRREECAAGMINGIWRKGLEDGGHFRAAWVTPNGFVFGVMRGRFGLTRNGHPVLIGKVIGPNGRFLGFVKGGYNVDASGDRGDWRALWFGRDRTTAIGGLQGHWASRDSTAAGFLNGRWHRFCSAEPAP